MLVAIIDDGISVDVVPSSKITHNILVSEQGNIEAVSINRRPLTDHGTRVAQIILSYAPDTLFCSLQIFHDTVLKANEVQLLAALHWCFQKKVPIIHLSIGTSNILFYQQIRAIISLMLQQGQFIIAAVSNRTEYCMPAGIHGVFKVRADAMMTGADYSANSYDSGFSFYASSRHLIKNEYTPCSNSYAAPTITAQICNILSSLNAVPNLVELYQKLTNSIPHILFPEPAENALILNCARLPLNNQFFCFKYSDVYYSYSDFLKNVGTHDKRSIIILTSNVAECEHEFRYCGQRPCSFFITVSSHTHKPVSIILKNWGMIIPHHNSPVVSYHQHETPIICIKNTSNHALSFLNNLCTNFTSKGYRCLCFSDSPVDYLYGLIICKSLTHLYTIINSTFAPHQIDIIIFLHCSAVHDHYLTLNTLFFELGTYCSALKYTIPNEVASDVCDDITFLSIAYFSKESY